MNMADYQTLEGVNWSTLKHLRDSALAYRYHLDVPVEDTPALQIGRLTHTLTFEPAQFDAEYAVWTGGVRRGKEWEAFQAANEGRTIFKPEEIDLAVAMANAVKAHPLVQPYLVGGQFEVPIQWTDPFTGIVCKAKPDWIIPQRRILLDLKTCRSIEGRRFGMDAARYGYHCQMGHYAAGCEHGLGWIPKTVLLVAVEKDPPHDVALFIVGVDDLYAGTEEVGELLRQLRAHTIAGEWPGRYDEPQALQMPAWVFGAEDEGNGDFGLQIGE